MADCIVTGAFRGFLCGVVLAAVASTAVGQTAPPLAGQVPGAQLKTWLDQNFSYAGRHISSGCYFMNSADASGRALFMSCPNGWSARIVGTARVAGDTICTNFPIPNQPPGEECLSWHATGDARYEQRRDGVVSTSLYVLPGVPLPGR